MLLQHLEIQHDHMSQDLAVNGLHHSQFLTPIPYYYFLQFQKTTGNYVGGTQLFQFHCVDVMASICTATVSRFLCSETNWPATQGAALLFAVLIHSPLFIMLFTAYLVPKDTKLQHGITGHDILWHQILCSGHSACKQMESIIFPIFVLQKDFFREPLKTLALVRSTFPAKP